ncbi:hypothetical protein HDU93_009792 [Gonapodya sp. JEL0774]|nr:hypothetical protein HDU93_009792 [Gonapodya sp. JEL0774]
MLLINLIWARPNRKRTYFGWAAVSSVAFLFALEPIPRAQRDILSKFPLFGWYWQEKLEEPGRAGGKQKGGSGRQQLAEGGGGGGNAAA